MIPKSLSLSSHYFGIKYRLLYLGLGIVVFTIAYLAGSAVPLTESDADSIRSDYLDKADNIDQSGIFLNNIGAALAMFIPGIGVGIGIYSGASTGIVFHAFAMTSEELAAINPLSVLLATPFGILELIAYGIAISRSGMLVAQIIKKDGRSKTAWRRTAIYTGIEIAVIVGALIVGSAIESGVIASQQQ